uniref:Uncharacterized protein n=1 Tax=Rhizophora mucronata TaxID=61149 RepID=A0A2P2MBU0_RHIMU
MVAEAPCFVLLMFSLSRCCTCYIFEGRNESCQL